jgi:GNAT superfamily N-acetyltransferase
MTDLTPRALPTPSHTIDPVTEADLPDLALLIRELADYEGLLDICHTSADGLCEALFGARPAAEALIVRTTVVGVNEAAPGVGTSSGEPVAFALWFQNFSTFACRPGIYLEDLYVRPAHRGAGLGTALLRRLAAICVDRDYARMEWAVLEWNELAKKRYRSIGAAPLDDWRLWRFTGDALRRFGGAE